MFPVLECDSVVQEHDRLRLDANKSFGFDVIDEIKIETEAAKGFSSIGDPDTRSAFLDWQYSGAGDKVVTLKIVSSGQDHTVSKTIRVVTASEDGLYSTDRDLRAEESLIDSFLDAGRNSFNNYHREAKRMILQDLKNRGLRKNDGSYLLSDDIIDSAEMRNWSTYLTLALIFKSKINSIDDIARIKASKYEDLALEASQNDVFSVDTNDDGIADHEEEFSLSGCWSRKGE